MSSKVYLLPAIGKVTITKRRANRNIRLSIGHDGDIKVSIPTYAPYLSGLNFVSTKSNWILANRPTKTILQNGQIIAGTYVLNMIEDNIQVPSSRIGNDTITVKYPAGHETSHHSIQASATQACIRAIRRQAEIRLPARLYELSGRYSVSYSQLTIKRLTRRWGSCDQTKRIVLNLFLVQLPDELIDYVILHELAHTKVLNHSEQFWKHLSEMDPYAKQHRRHLRTYHPGIIPVLGVS